MPQPPVGPLSAQPHPDFETLPCVRGQDPFEKLTKAASHLRGKGARPHSMQRTPSEGLKLCRPFLQCATVSGQWLALGLISVSNTCVWRAYYVPGTLLGPGQRCEHTKSQLLKCTVWRETPHRSGNQHAVKTMSDCDNSRKKMNPCATVSNRVRSLIFNREVREGCWGSGGVTFE